MPPDAAAELRSVAGELGLAPQDAQIDALVRFLALLQRWNATYNLTAVRDPAQMLTQHLADCLAALVPLRRWLDGHPGVRKVLDVGSGGGLPGAMIAIVLPELEVTCVDTVGKKAAFIRQVAVELRLPNLRAEHARVEALGGGPFDVVVSRAFASLEDFVRLTRSHVGSEGAWLAMKGKRPDDEIAALPADINVFHVEPLRVPGLSAERCLVWMKPSRLTGAAAG